MNDARVRLAGVHAAAALAAALAALPLAAGGQATLTVADADVELPAADVSDYAARATRPGAIRFAVAGCDGAAGCTLAIWSPVANGEIEWQLDGIAPDRWRPLGALPSAGEVLRGRGERRGVIYLRVRIDWERDAAAAPLAAVRLSLATN